MLAALSRGQDVFRDQGAGIPDVESDSATDELRMQNGGWREVLGSSLRTNPAVDVLVGLRDV